MFEKEAEEYRKDLKSKFFLSEPQLDLACQGFKDGYNKANEWHYVKNGDYPKDNKSVLCILGDVDSDNYEVGHYNGVGSCEHWYFESFRLSDDDGDNAWGVSAWKEIFHRR